MTFDDSEKDRANQGMPRNLLENFRMVNLVTQNWSHIISMHFVTMGFPNPSLSAYCLLLFLQFFSSSLNDHDFIYYEMVGKDSLLAEEKVLQGHPNFSMIVKILNILVQRLAKNGFTEKASNEMLFEAIKVVIQSNLSSSYSAKVTALFNSIFNTSIKRYSTIPSFK